MEEKDMIYTVKIPVEFKVESSEAGERSRMMEENWNAIGKIESEAVKRGGLLYRFVYEPTDRGIAIYQVVKFNRISCMLRYCSIDGSQDTMIEQWGNETYVGTEYVMKRITSWDMALGLGNTANIKVSEEMNHADVKELAYRFGKWYLHIRVCDDGYDYSIYGESFLFYDGGGFSDGQMDIFDVAQILLKDIVEGLENPAGASAEQVDPEKLAEAAGSMNAIPHDGIDPAILARLIAGNAGDDVALNNICEVHRECVDELTEDEKEYYIETNSFYRSAEEFSFIHETEPEYFEWLVGNGTIIKTTDGYVYKNCV